jgi:zinc transport system substrate-binding protein
MRKTKLLIIIVLAGFLAGCTSRQPDDGKPVVTVTILPLQYFAEQLTGENFKINVMVPPGANHHNYDPSPQQLRELEKSRALFMIGKLGFEEVWVPKMKSNYPNLAIVDLSGGISLVADEVGEGTHDHEEGESADHHDHGHGGVDPHYWMSPAEAKQLAVTMANGLIRADGACEQMIRQNLDRLTQRIDSLDSAYRTRLENLTHRSFMIFHPALAYLARDYNLVQHSMEEGGKEPAASHFRELVDLSHSENINTIFVQKEYDQENARTLARETGSTIVSIDPMSPDWFLEMEQLLEKLVEMDKR